MMFRPIKHMHFDAKNDPELIKKINAVARNKKRKPHDLARIGLNDWLDEQINKQGIDTLDAQGSPQKASSSQNTDKDDTQAIQNEKCA